MHVARTRDEAAQADFVATPQAVGERMRAAGSARGPVAGAEGVRAAYQNLALQLVYAELEPGNTTGQQETEDPPCCVQTIQHTLMRAVHRDLSRQQPFSGSHPISPSWEGSWCNTDSLALAAAIFRVLGTPSIPGICRQRDSVNPWQAQTKGQRHSLPCAGRGAGSEGPFKRFSDGGPMKGRGAARGDP